MNVTAEAFPTQVGDFDQDTVKSARQLLKQNEEACVTSNNSKRMPDWLTSTNKSLLAIVALNNNWDSYGANRISPKVAEATHDLLWNVMQKTTPAPQVVPSANGSIQLEWHLKRIDLEIEVKSFSKFRVFFEDAQNEEPTWDGDVDVDLTKIVRYINLLTVRAQQNIN
jgi:hypothetical protein